MARWARKRQRQNAVKPSTRSDSFPACVEACQTNCSGTVCARRKVKSGSACRSSSPSTLSHKWSNSLRSCLFLPCCTLLLVSHSRAPLLPLPLHVAVSGHAARRCYPVLDSCCGKHGIAWHDQLEVRSGQDRQVRSGKRLPVPVRFPFVPGLFDIKDIHGCPTSHDVRAVVLLVLHA